jgi:hypothetical protein
MSTTVIAGIMLIALPLAFNAAFALLASSFDYPDVLRRPTTQVLDRFREGGSSLLLLWWSFTLTAVLLAPLAVLVSASLPGAAPTILSLATVTGVLAAAVQFLGLVRWPFLVPYLARTAQSEDPATRAAVEVVFQSFNRYLGVAVGEHLGYLFTGAWSALVGAAILQSTVVPAWLGIVGLVIGLLLAVSAAEFVGRFEPNGWQVAARITPIVFVGWSLWLISLGVALLL